MKTYKIKGTMLIDVEWEVSADSEHDALSKFYAADARDVIDECIITDVNTENESAELAEGTFVIKTKEIGYSVEFEDVADQVEERFPNIEFDSEEFEAKVDSEIERIKKELPQELTLEVDCEKEDLDDYVSEAVSDETGWLVDYVNYELVEVK